MRVKRSHTNDQDELVYIDDLGREFTEILFFVEGKRIAAEVVEADTKEGWLIFEDPDLEPIDPKLLGKDHTLLVGTEAYSPVEKRVEGTINVMVSVTRNA